MESFLLAIYFIFLTYTLVRILLYTQSTPKTLAYIILVFFLPLAGMIIYYSFGINYRRQKINSKAPCLQLELDNSIAKEQINQTAELLEAHKHDLGHFSQMVRFLEGIGGEHLFKSGFKLLVNGEEKFPEVLRTLETAQHFIHMEYYDWENDIRGNQIKDVLLKKAKQGVEIRVLFDDYASRKIKRNIVRELRQGGVEIYPKIKVKFKQFANRLNHRDHRKVIIVDGRYGFVGGINVSDRYDNSIDTGLYWRDTHVKISGPLTNSLQRHFIVSWNSSTVKPLSYNKLFFPIPDENTIIGVPSLGQVVAGGPIYPKSNIMLSYMRLFTLAKEKLYITNPYFIPSESILDAMCQAAISGVDVRLMVPEKPDSMIVGAASRFYYSRLLKSGVRIFHYTKGFLHAKTVVADSRASIVGTANMDIRSFDLNFEIMSVIYGAAYSSLMEELFLKDLTESREVVLSEWERTTILRRISYAVARLVSSFL